MQIRSDMGKNKKTEKLKEKKTIKRRKKKKGAIFWHQMTTKPDNLFFLVHYDTYINYTYIPTQTHDQLPTNWSSTTNWHASKE